MRVIIRLLSLVSHTTIVTAVVILLLHRLIVAVYCRDHLVQDVFLALRSALKLVWLVADDQVGPAVSGRSSYRIVALHDGQILFDCLRRILDVNEIFEKPLVVF